MDTTKVRTYRNVKPKLALRRHTVEVQERIPAQETAMKLLLGVVAAIVVMAVWPPEVPRPTPGPSPRLLCLAARMWVALHLGCLLSGPLVGAQEGRRTQLVVVSGSWNPRALPMALSPCGLCLALLGACPAIALYQGSWSELPMLPGHPEVLEPLLFAPYLGEEGCPPLLGPWVHPPPASLTLRGQMELLADSAPPPVGLSALGAAACAC
ncbi:UNVERIFIED_CONTAM: hypothetical protein K2H54_069190 [Gekko kuhli]